MMTMRQYIVLRFGIDGGAWFHAMSKGWDMNQDERVTSAVHAWAPELAESLNALAYLGSETAIQWLTESSWSSQMDLLAQGNGHATAAELWRRVLRDGVSLPAPALLLILEHMRRRPAETGMSLQAAALEFSRTLGNVAFRAADALYESAKASFAGDELDVAITRFRAALAEFRFAIESEMLSDATKKIATGKYATAVAMIGRWINVAPDAVSRALSYSQASMTLGNVQPETFIYRLELLVQQFDQTGDPGLLRESLVLQSQNQHISGSEVAEAEARYRLAQLAAPGSREARRYLTSARRLLERCNPRNSVEDVRRKVLHLLVTKTVNGELPASPQSVASPRGILAQMATQPSTELWRTVRMMIGELNDLRLNGGSIPAAVLCARFLRQMIDGPRELLEPTDIALYVEITGRLAQRATWNRHVQWEAGAAALSAAKRTGNFDLARQAQATFDALAAQYPTWPLPRIGIARVGDFLAPALQGATSTAAESWRHAADLALRSTIYARSTLGGRNAVFAVADARGFLSETFVFKRTTKSNAEHEAVMLKALRDEVLRLGIANRFEVPRSLAIVEVPSADDRRWVHVSQRAAGRLVSDLAAEEAHAALDSIVDFLAIFHRIAGDAPAGKSAWQPLKAHLKMWSRTLFEPAKADDFVDSLRRTFPSELQLVRKRDGHASNWLLDPAGRVVAVDFESNDFIPIGYDVAQLIEDNGLVQASREGWQRRLALMSRYLQGLGQALSESAISSAYGWFAITRALRLGTEREAGKQLRRHARELCGMLVEYGDASTVGIARELLQALSRIEHTDPTESAPTHDHRRLSKAMAYQLRHQGPSNGVPIDSAGFAAMEDLARALNVDASELLAVAEHPGEPRYELRDGRIRALYGHSIEVVVDAAIDVGTPQQLYHGSSWSALDSIVRDGLTPMQRRMVHLTNTAEEAMAVGRRKGATLVFAIDQSHDEEPVADGIWVTARVPPQRLSIINPFVEEAGAVR
jgi:RNA:NAD 2'-phosphotransferase (TPT1/KptA family)